MKTLNNMLNINVENDEPYKKSVIIDQINCDNC